MKRFLIRIWKFWILTIVRLNSRSSNRHSSSPLKPRVFYSGALGGSRGGPRVKVLRLQKRFPKHSVGFNLVYALSNYPYLTTEAIHHIKSRGIPLVLNQNGVYSSGWYGQGWQERNTANANIYQNCDYVFWQSKFARESARNFLSSIEPDGEILHNAVDLSLFYPVKKATHVRDFRFLLAGNFSSLSNLYQIQSCLEALALIRNRSHITVVFAGLSRELVRISLKLAKSLKVDDSLEFVGKFSQNQCPQLMQNVDTYIALKFQDTCPNLVIESLASGVPIIYSATGGTTELVDEKCGIGLHVPGDWSSTPQAPKPYELATAMESMIETSEEMGVAARTKAEESFDIRNWYTRHSIIFENLISERL